MTDPRVGKYGETKPTQTLCGNEAVQPWGCVIGLGGDFFVVKDIFPCPDWQEQVAELRTKMAMPEPKKGSRS